MTSAPYENSAAAAKYGSPRNTGRSDVIYCTDKRTEIVRPFAMYPETRQILDFCAEHNLVLTICSRSPEIIVVEQIMRAFGIWEWFLFPQVYYKRKTFHFRNLTEVTGFKMRDFLFYDDEPSNITMCQRMGVNSCLVDKAKGLNWATFIDGLQLYCEKLQCRRSFSTWMTTGTSTGAGSVSGGDQQSQADSGMDSPQRLSESSRQSTPPFVLAAAPPFSTRFASFQPAPLAMQISIRNSANNSNSNSRAPSRAPSQKGPDFQNTSPQTQQAGEQLQLQQSQQSQSQSSDLQGYYQQQMQPLSSATQGVPLLTASASSLPLYSTTLSRSNSSQSAAIINNSAIGMNFDLTPRGVLHAGSQMTNLSPSLPSESPLSHQSSSDTNFVLQMVDFSRFKARNSSVPIGGSSGGVSASSSVKTTPTHGLSAKTPTSSTTASATALNAIGSYGVSPSTVAPIVTAHSTGVVSGEANNNTMMSGIDDRRSSRANSGSSVSSSSALSIAAALLLEPSPRNFSSSNNNNNGNFNNNISNNRDNLDGGGIDARSNS